MDRHDEQARKLSKDIGKKAARKQRARRRSNESVWFGLGMFGLVGWSVMIPTLLALALGIWIDSTWPSRISWTLTLLFVGVVMGCLNAWLWITRERRLIVQKQEREDQDE